MLQKQATPLPTTTTLLAAATLLFCQEIQLEGANYDSKSTGTGTEEKWLPIHAMHGQLASLVWLDLAQEEPHEVRLTHDWKLMGIVII